MNATLHKQPLWTIGEAAEVLGLGAEDGRRAIRVLIRTYGIAPKPMYNHKAKGLDRADLEVLARALNLTIDWEAERRGP